MWDMGSVTRPRPGTRNIRPKVRVEDGEMRLWRNVAEKWGERSCLQAQHIRRCNLCSSEGRRAKHLRQISIIGPSLTVAPLQKKMLCGVFEEQWWAQGFEARGSGGLRVCLRIIRSLRFRAGDPLWLAQDRWGPPDQPGIPPNGDGQVTFTNTHRWKKRLLP